MCVLRICVCLCLRNCVVGNGGVGVSVCVRARVCVCMCVGEGAGYGGEVCTCVFVFMFVSVLVLRNSLCEGAEERERECVGGRGLRTYYTLTAEVQRLEHSHPLQGRSDCGNTGIPDLVAWFIRTWGKGDE